MSEPVGLCGLAAAKAARESKRWRAMFEHAAQLIADEIDAYGLAGDEATEEIERWAALAAGKVEP